MKKILTLITVLSITAPAYAQEYSKKELKSINKGREAAIITFSRAKN